MAEVEVGNPEPGGSGSAEDPEIERVASQTAYDAFLVAARALEPGFIEECCADAALVYHCVVRGTEDVLGSGMVIIGKLPNVDVVELSMLPRLAQALAFAVSQVQRATRASSFGPLFERAQRLRRKLRKAAEALAESGLLPDADVDELWLQAPQDPLDDCLALAALLRRNETRITGRCAVTAFDLLEVEQVIATLRTMIGQAESGAGAEPSLVKALDTRDRLWTLLKQRYDVLWRCGAWIYGPSVSDHVPSLPVRRSTIRKPRVEQVTASSPSRALSRPASPSLPPSPRASPSVSAPETSRHLQELQNTMERKTRFLVRIGAIRPGG